MKHSAVQPPQNPTISCSTILLENLVQPDNKVCQLERLVNWKYLDDELGHLFKGESAPPSRLILGLLYLQSIDNLSYFDVMAKWKQSPEWQYFCGETFLNEAFPLHHASLSIWSRIVGPYGREMMIRALGTAKYHATLH